MGGYIRDTQRRLDERSIICDLIRCAILSFYWHRDKFNERACGECLEIYGADKSIWKSDWRPRHSRRVLQIHDPYPNGVRVGAESLSVHRIFLGFLHRRNQRPNMSVWPAVSLYFENEELAIAS